MSSHRVRNAHLIAIIAATLLSTAGFAAYAAARAAELPDRIATHFGAGGAGDDFMARGAGLVTFGAVIFVVPLVMLVLFWAVRWWEATQARWATGLAAGLAVFLAMIGVAVVSVNAEVADPADATVGVVWIVAAVVVGVLAGTLAASWLPVAPPRDQSKQVEALTLRGDERAAWFGDVTWHPAMKYGAFALLIGCVVLVTLVPAGPGTWVALVAVAIGALAIVSATSFRVRVDARGVRWHSGIGLPRGTTPLSEIEGADVVEVSPVNYGGIGLRITGHSIGLISKTGHGLRVRRHGRDLVATVDDPETAAGLIEALKARCPVS